MSDMELQMVRALAAIDAELGMPEDGCNSTQATLTAIRLLHAVRRDDEAEIERLKACLKSANDQAEHFERSWYLNKEDADRYAFAKTLEGQVVTTETFKSHGAAALDEALDDAMAEDADARNEAGYGA